MKPPIRKLLVVAVAAIAVAVGGVALASAAGTTSTPSAFMESLAKHLGISTEKLQDAAKAAAIDQIDAALAEGKITKEQADAAKERIQSARGRCCLARGSAEARLPRRPGLRARAASLRRAADRRRHVPRADRGGAARAAGERQVAGRRSGGRGQVDGRPEGCSPRRRQARIWLRRSRPAGSRRRADEALQRFDERADDLIARPGERPLRPLPCPRPIF